MSYIQVSSENHVAVLTIDRPKALNALNSEVLGELEAAIDALDLSDVRALTRRNGKNADCSSCINQSHFLIEAGNRIRNDMGQRDLFTRNKFLNNSLFGFFCHL